MCRHFLSLYENEARMIRLRAQTSCSDEVLWSQSLRSGKQSSAVIVMFNLIYIASNYWWEVNLPK